MRCDLLMFVVLMRFVDDLGYAYGLGPDLFVWPLLEEVTRVTVTLPADGNWSYVFGPTVYSGGADVEIDVPMDEYPLFVRVGSEAEVLLQGYRQ